MAYNLGQVDPEERTELYADPRDEEYRRPRRLLRIAVALAVMGVFAGGLWFAYNAGMRHAGGAADSADIPLIRADTRPIKVKPDNPGGMQIPDRDMLIYGQQRPQVEHLLPPPEQPMARPALRRRLRRRATPDASCERGPTTPPAARSGAVGRPAAPSPRQQPPVASLPGRAK